MTYYICPLLEEEYYYKELNEILVSDDKDRFLTLISDFANRLCTYLVAACAIYHAKKCLLAMIQGEGCCVPTVELYARLVPRYGWTQTPLVSVAYFFHEVDDITDLLLEQRPEHANVKSFAGAMSIGSPLTTFPLDHLLFSLSSKSHLDQRAPGNSLNKLIILLCQWEMKSSLNSARLLASHTNGLNNLAWEYVKDGRLVSLAALLLVAHETVLVPLDSGTIRQRITEMMDALSSECNLDREGAKYQSMLIIETCKLLDIFERAGDALNLYCSSMREYVPPHTVLIDVAGMLKKAGYALSRVSPMDLDLRDCYRQCPELKNGSLFKLSDTEGPNNEHLLPPSLTQGQGFCATGLSYPRVGESQLFHKVKTGPMLNLLRSDASMPRLLRTAASQVHNGVSGTLKHFTYIAFRLKRGIKF